MNFSVNGIQHIAIGVSNAKAAAKWYKENYNFITHLNQSTETATNLQALTGGRQEYRTCIQIANIHGGGGALQLWQYTNRPQQESKMSYGMLGINALMLDCYNMQQLQLHLKQDHIPSYPVLNPLGNSCLFVNDYFNHNAFFTAQNAAKKNLVNSGIKGAVIGVSNVDASLEFYRKFFPNLVIDFDQTGQFTDLMGAEKRVFRRVQFSIEATAASSFSSLIGTSTIQLLQAINEVGVRRTYENKFWGDTGLMHIGFDVVNATALLAYLEEQKIPVLANSFTQVTGSIIANHIYVKDVDGTVLLFTEILQIPLNKKWNWYLKINDKNKYKLLPKWKINVLGLQKMNY